MVGKGWSVVTGGELFVQFLFGTGLRFWLRSVGPGWPRSVAERPARARSAGAKIGSTKTTGCDFSASFHAAAASFFSLRSSR